MSLKGIFPIDKWNFGTQSILEGLSPDEYEQLFEGATEKKYTKGEQVFREGTIPSGIYYINEGKVKKYKVDHFGKELIIYVANSGEFIGYHALLASEHYPDSAMALEDCMISFIPKDSFLAVLERAPLLSRKLLKTLSHEFGVLANNISVFVQHSVRERLAITLLVLREKYKNNPVEDQPVMINVSREDIANMTGATRENIVRLLGDFKDEGLIEAKGRKIWIIDVKRLAAISNYR